jgi:serine/threonine protein phosphatase PrpC
MVPDEKIAATLRRFSHDINLFAAKLIEEANAAGGVDNITAIVIRYTGEGN